MAKVVLGGMLALVALTTAALLLSFGGRAVSRQSSTAKPQRKTEVVVLQTATRGRSSHTGCAERLAPEI